MGDYDEIGKAAEFFMRLCLWLGLALVLILGAAITFFLLWLTK